MLVGSELQSIKEVIREMTQDQRARDEALMAAIEKLIASVDALHEQSVRPSPVAVPNNAGVSTRTIFATIDS
jgi:hypothetical protein